MHKGIKNYRDWALDARMGQDGRNETKAIRDLDCVYELVYFVNPIAPNKAS